MEVRGDDNQNEETVSDETQQPEADQTPEVQAEPTPEPEAPKQKRGRKPKTPEPSIGRMVRYVTASETVRPAVITRVNEESVDLTVFNSQGAVPVPGVRPADFDPEVPLENTYHWPEFN